MIPRLRKTPYWLIRRKSYTEEQIAEITALNDKWKGIDHAKAREAIVRWVRETGNKVLICPEMTYQVDIMDELLIDPLPDDVKGMSSSAVIGYRMRLPLCIAKLSVSLVLNVILLLSLCGTGHLHFTSASQKIR